MTRHPFIGVLFFLELLSLRAFPGSIAGRVMSESDHEGVAGVRVFLQGTVRGVSTGAQGEFRLAEISPGTYTLVFSMIGYQRLTVAGVVVRDTGETVLTVKMIQVPIETDQIVVTANKREQSLDEVPASISVVDATAIERRNAQSIDEVLRYVPGVNITGTQVNIRGFSGYSLGAGSRVLMLLDGIPFIAGDTGELNFESVPMEEVERVEVVKGASSALYGSNALGGVINLITKPIPEGEATTVRMYGGLYSNFPDPEWQWSDHKRYTTGESVSHVHREGNIGFSLYASNQSDDGYRQNDYHRRYSMLLRLKEYSASSTSLSLNFGLVHQNAGQFLFWRNIDSALIPPKPNQADNETSTRYFLSGIYSSAMSDHVLMTVKALWYHNDWGWEQTGQDARTGSLADDLRLEVQSTILPSDLHTVTLGVTATADLIGGDIFATQTLGGFAVYGQDEWKVADMITFTAGMRFDLQTVGLASNAGQLNPKVALTYRPLDGMTLRASFSQGFRVPSLPEAFVAAGTTGVIAVPNPDLRPEKSTSYELGMSQSLGDAGALDIAAFRSEINNLIEPGLIVSGSNLELQWRNVTRARIQGFETSVKLGLPSKVAATEFGYTYSYPQDLTLHQLLKYRPRHVLYVSARSTLGWFSADYDFRFISRVDQIDDQLVLSGIIPDGDQRVPIYVSDVRVGADFKLGNVPTSVTFGVNNLFQHRYVELIGNIMPPRNYVLVVQTRL